MKAVFKSSRSTVLRHEIKPNMGEISKCFENWADRADWADWADWATWADWDRDQTFKKSFKK